MRAASAAIVSPIRSSGRSLASVPNGSSISTPISSIPFFIVVPGSYYLTANLATSGTNAGIDILASNVTLDLNGFTLSTSAPVVSPHGVRIQGVSNVTVRNGSVAGFPIGVIADFTSRNVRFENLQVSGASAGGLLNTANPAAIDGCLVNTSGTGVQVFQNATVTNCTAADNLGDGFKLGTGSVLSNCVARGNTVGIRADPSVTVHHCSVSGNTAHGILVADSSFIHDNDVTSNGVSGITVAGSGSRIEGNNLASNGSFGLNLGGTNNIAMRNSAHGNAGVPDPNWSFNVPNVIVIEDGTVVAPSNPWANVTY